MSRSVSSRWAKGSTREWRRVRAAVLARDHNRCQLRLAKCTTVATAVHHTQARELVGDDPRYLVAACVSCNNTVSDPTACDPKPRPRIR